MSTHTDGLVLNLDNASTVESGFSSVKVFNPNEMFKPQRVNNPHGFTYGTDVETVFSALIKHFYFIFNFNYSSEPFSEDWLVVESLVDILPDSLTVSDSIVESAESSALSNPFSTRISSSLVSP